MIIFTNKPDGTLEVSLKVDAPDYLKNITDGTPTESVLHDMMEGVNCECIFINPKTIVKQVDLKLIPIEKEPFVSETFICNETGNIVSAWLHDNTTVFKFIPLPENEKTKLTAFAKVAANMWATFSGESIFDGAFNANARFNSLQNTKEHLLSAKGNLSGTYKQDKEIDDFLVEATKLIDKECAVCVEKVNIVKIICNGDFNMDSTVKKEYENYKSK